jgi:ABC-type uncharacterized transport system substrate-binding protein
VSCALRHWLVVIWLLGGALASGASPAEAHPHVWITASSALIYAPDGTLTAVRHAWTFDEMYSSFAVQELESKTKGVYSRDELAPLAQTNALSLKEFHFFTFAKADGRKQPFEDPVDYSMEFKDSLLTLYFTLPLQAKVQSKQLLLEIFDPEFFIDFSFAENNPVKLVGAPAACRFRFQRPNDGAARAQQLGEQNFQSGDNSNFGALYANKIVVDCP